MANRALQAKTIKLKRQRRAWARPLSVKSGIQPNRDVIRQYQDTAKGLGKPIAEAIYKNVQPGRYETKNRADEILRQFNDPLFFTYIENSHQRVRIFFDSKHTKFIIQWVQFRHKKAYISKPFMSTDDAIYAFQNDLITWHCVMPF